jgi:undecaprenyl phosphate N,N'-diacetylbacillosamine 1-phosphate transferase
MWTSSVKLKFYLLYKRLIDILFCIVIAPIFIPLIIIISIYVYIFIGHPIIFKQERVGKDNKIFNIYKFRTMLALYDENMNLLPNNMRFSKYGNFLRITSLDELPTLINVFIGHMTLVGPRPLLVEYLDYYNENEKKRHTVHPGITGFAQVNGRNSISWQDKFAKDLYYVNNMSILLDLKILFKTIASVFYMTGTKSLDGTTTMTKFSGSKTILICGGGWDQCPIISYSKKRGYKTILADFDENCSGKMLADKFYKVSTRDKDQLKAIALDHNVDGLTYMITESPITALAEISKELDLEGPSIKSANATFSKAKMRLYLKESGIEDISFSVCKNINDALDSLANLSFPAVMKPADVGGQLGLYFLNNKQDLIDNFDESLIHSVAGDVIIEDFIEGPEINGVAVVVNGKIKEAVFSDRIKSKKESFGIVQRHIYPSLHVNKKEGTDYVQKIVDALDINNAIIFPQFIKTQKGLRLCEIGERIPGGVMKELFEYSTGIDLVDLQIDISLNQIKELKSYIKYDVYKSVTVKFINAVNDQLNIGEITDIDTGDALKIPGILKMETYNDPNKEIEIRPLENARDRFYFIVAGADSREKCIKISNAASCLVSFRNPNMEHNKIPFNMEP